MRRKRALIALGLVGVVWTFGCNKKNGHEDSSHHEEAEGTTEGDGHHAKESAEAEDHGSAHGEIKDPLKESEEAAHRQKRPLCDSLEYAGVGPEAPALTDEEWKGIEALFSEAKSGLEKWLSQGGNNLNKKVFSWMKGQLQSLELEKPPYKKDKDLAWRGVGVFSTEGDHGVVRLGSGFFELAKKDRDRAKFELTRLAAQVWSPCEVGKVEGGASTWNGLLECLQVHEEQGSCGAGTYSNSGWAVSTALASHVVPLKCAVPAFEKAVFQGCVDQIPLHAWLETGTQVASNLNAKPFSKKDSL